MPDRWTPARKAALLMKIARNRMTLAEAERLHGYSAEEITEMQRLIKAHGMAGLRCTRMKEYRDG